MTDKLTLFGKEDVRKILAALEHEPRSARRLSDECGVPLTSTYRYISKLADCGLLKTETKVDLDGNHYQVYRSTFQGCLLYIEDGEMKEDIYQETAEDGENLARVWDQIREVS